MHGHSLRTGRVVAVSGFAQANAWRGLSRVCICSVYVPESTAHTSRRAAREGVWASALSIGRQYVGSSDGHRHGSMHVGLCFARPGGSSDCAAMHARGAMHLLAGTNDNAWPGRYGVG
jgi:hypothetical protein